MSVADLHLMLAFEGTVVPDWLRDWLGRSPPAGVTLFRELNMTDPSQVAELTSALQRANGEDLPLLVAVDQEGGQLTGLAGSTPFGGNMALGAAADPELTRHVSEAMARELKAVGVNLNYAPVADVASRPRNPSLGVRSFGEDALSVAAHVAAAVVGFRAGGVLATLKHFPGKGEATVDPHYELPRMDLDMGRLWEVELPPFASGMSAGADVLMTGHYSVPALTDTDDLPVSMSARAIDGFVREEMGFGGLVITDALDMGALEQGAAQVVDIIATMTGGTDLLLCMPDTALRDRARLAVDRGVGRGLIGADSLRRSEARLAAVRAGLAMSDPDPAVVGSHGRLADELAARSVTLVRNDAGVIPLRLAPDEKVLVLEPSPTNVTPADTTALYAPMLGEEMRRRHGAVQAIVYPHDPRPVEIGELLVAARGHSVVVLGTVNATPGQAELAQGLSSLESTLVTVSMREPQDLGSYPGVSTHIAAYSGHAPSMSAVVAAMFGERHFQGRLPVSIPGLYPVGHGL